MEQEDPETDRRLQIKKLKEKVKSLVSGIDILDVENEFKSQHENDRDGFLGDGKSCGDFKSEDSEDEFVDCKEFDFSDDTTWLFDSGDPSKLVFESVTDICKSIYTDIVDCQPDVKEIYHELQVLKKWSSSSLESYTSSSGGSGVSNSTYTQKNLIDSRTFTRPKKSMSRASISSVTSTDEEGGSRMRLQRRLTTTITPSPNLISKLEELSKVNNRPISGNYSDVNWEDGSEGLADVGKGQRQSIPASLFERLQELKRSNKIEMNSSYNVNGRTDDRNTALLIEDAKRIKSGFDLGVHGTTSSSRLSEIFRNTPEYFSDDNESFISLDEVSSFCDRLTLSTDQNTYSTIVREMEEHDICLYHRKLNDDQIPESRLTFGGMEIPPLLGNENINFSNHNSDKTGEMNNTYELGNITEEKVNRTFEVQANEKLTNVLNSTYDPAEIKPGLVDVIMQSNIIKNLSTNNDFTNHNHKSFFADKDVLNNTYEKFNGTYNKNEINCYNNEKYSTKIFDSTFKKSTHNENSPPEKINVKKDSDHSEDDCMSTTSDNSYRSVESNSDVKNIEELKNIAMQQSKKLGEAKFSTPKSVAGRVVSDRHSEEWRVFSPIKREPENGGSQGSSNASSRGPSPRMFQAHSQASIAEAKHRPTIKQPLKAPQRELKLKPGLIQPTQNFKKPVNQPRPVSEPVAPTKADCSTIPASCVPAMRPSGSTTVPSQPNLRPVSRASGIPRPPSRLKQPQIRLSEVPKKF